MKVLVNRGMHRIECQACKVEIRHGERYVRCTAGSFHTAHFLDAHGRPIAEPKTALEHSREKIPLRTMALRPMEESS